MKEVKCEAPSVVSGEFYFNQATFKTDNILTTAPDDEAKKKYWLGNNFKPATAILNLGCEKTVNMVELINTHNNVHRDRSTREIKIDVSKDEKGPWVEVLKVTLEDSRGQKDPGPLQRFPFESKKAKFVKIELVSWYLNGAGLSYFNVLGESLQKLIF